MQNMLERNAVTLLVGAESNHQNSVAYEIIARSLCDGATVCMLAETQGDITVFRSRLMLWLRACERNPNHAERIVGLPDYRLYRDGEQLAPRILDVCQGRFETRRSVEQKSIVVFLDLASAMLPTLPGDHRLTVCADLPIWLPNATVLITAQHGPEAMPPPRFSTYAVDRVYKVQGANVAMNIRVTPIKPEGDTIKLSGRVHRDGIVLIDEPESEHV
jgi:hypothetical protein